LKQPFRWDQTRAPIALRQFLTSGKIEGSKMKKFSIVSIFILLMTNPVQAKQGHVLHGLFCNTKSQIEATFAHIRHDIAPQIAVAMTNQDSVVCVEASRISYLVINPVRIDKVQHNGQWLLMYEATLIGVLVGDNPRPIVPPLQTFFVPSEPIAGVGSQGGA
jgi:hypothetical protein